MQFLLARTNIY